MVRLFLAGLKSTVGILLRHKFNEIVSKINEKVVHNGKIAIVAILKDEASYVQEWVEYHRLIGVDFFYIYDNGSTDNIKEVLQTYIDAGIVDYQYFPGEGMQENAYLDAAKKASDFYSWIIAIDIDEFVEPMSETKLKTWLETFSDKTSQILLGWMIFGSSGYIERPEGLVINAYHQRASDDFIADYKAIARPNKIIECKMPHAFQCVGRTVNERGKRLLSYPLARVGAVPAPREKFRVNHYYSKSFSEFQLKSARGDASVPGRPPRGLKDFKEHDQNEVSDYSMKKYGEVVQQRIYAKRKVNE
ncbi:MAG: glycosyltransferase family 92 protein [Lactobacillus sp.]|jgi:hypothetical protein|nr:glycosyltransferase family 92 protein [Lactobacillus sp.]